MEKALRHLGRLIHRRAGLLTLVVLASLVPAAYLATQLDGPDFILRPIPLTLAVITVAFLGYNIWGIVQHRKEAKADGE